MERQVNWLLLRSITGCSWTSSPWGQQPRLTWGSSWWTERRWGWWGCSCPWSSTPPCSRRKHPAAFPWWLHYSLCCCPCSPECWSRWRMEVMWKLLRNGKVRFFWVLFDFLSFGDTANHRVCVYTLTPSVLKVEMPDLLVTTTGFTTNKDLLSAFFLFVFFAFASTNSHSQTALEGRHNWKIKSRDAGVAVRVFVDRHVTECHRI